MDILRYLLTIVLFFIGIFFLIRCMLEGFNFLFLAASLICFLLAYWVKPKRENHRHRDNGRDWLDIIDFPVELIYWIITLPLRLLRGIFDFLSPDIP